MLIKLNSSQNGYTPIVSENEGVMESCQYGYLQLSPNQTYSEVNEDMEVALVILSGTCSINSAHYSWQGIGKRKDVFSGKATAVYIPLKAGYTITAVSIVEIAVCKSKATKEMKHALITPDMVEEIKVGSSCWEREVHTIITPNSVETERMTIGETFNPPGNWSGFPPHKHDELDSPDETKQEEIYLFRSQPEDGFGLQRIYTEDGTLDESYVVKNNSVILIPQGYHPFVAQPGYKFYYLWFLSGAKSNEVKVQLDKRYASMGS